MKGQELELFFNQTKEQLKLATWNDFMSIYKLLQKESRETTIATYSLRHCDFVQLQGFLSLLVSGAAGVAVAM